MRKLKGKDVAKAAKRGAALQAEAGQEAIELTEEARARAQGFFEPFAGVAERGIEEAGFLADPQAQFEFIQQNPLFALALEDATRRTEARATSRGRLSAGDTLAQLGQNVLLSAQPLVQRQREDILNLLNLGTGIAGSRANIETGQAARVGELTTDIGAARAAGLVGSASAKAAGAQNIVNLVTGAVSAGAGAFGGGAGAVPAPAGSGLGGGGAQNLLTISDERLKTNRKIIGNHNGHAWWSWDWNELAGKLFGMFGRSEGVMAQEVLSIKPDAVVLQDGFYKVNYGAL